YYAKGPRRRPVRIDFCEADVLDVFDEWRRAVGLPASGASGDEPSADRPPSSAGRARSLPVHLERVLLRLSSARAAGTLGPSFDDLLDGVARELEAARAAKGLRGAAREASIERLSALDDELMVRARTRVDPATMAAMSEEAEAELAVFRSTMD